MPKRMEVSVLGRHLGTALNWDGDPDTFWFEDFQPRAGIDLKPGWLQIDFVKGHIGSQNEDDGSITDPKDICTFLATITRKD